MELSEILSRAIQLGASDIHLKHGVMPIIRVSGRLMPLDSKGERLTGEQIAEMANQIMSAAHKEKFNETHEVDLGYGVSGLGRFRINIFQQRGSVGMVIRTISYQVKSLEELNLPKILETICNQERGLILVTGTTGSGKSTTLASMMDFINQHRNCHILTIEDPIEYTLRDKRCIINQRELGFDTPGFAVALRQALRQDPDVILIGEMRDKETIQTALLAAETGHTVFSTLHTTDATETINRILATFEPHQQLQLRQQLAGSLKAVISQRLIPRANGEGMLPACEIMITNSRIRDMISDPQKTREIKMAIEEGANNGGMQTFDQSLMNLVTKKLITYDEARAASTSPEDFELRFKGVTSMDRNKWRGFDKNEVTQPSIKSVVLATMPNIKGERDPIDIPGQEDEKEKAKNSLRNLLKSKLKP